MKTYTADTRPRCVAFVHPAMGTMKCCGKMADWLLANVPNHTDNHKYGAMPVCRDCVAKVIINAGDGIDNVTFDIIVVKK